MSSSDQQDTPRGSSNSFSQFSQNADLSEGDEMRLLALADSAARLNNSNSQSFDS